MKHFIFLILLLIITSICSSADASAQAGYTIHIGKNGLVVLPDELVNYYQAPPDRVGWLNGAKIPEDQWPLLFELAHAGKVTPDRVWEIRRQQSGWADVLEELGVSPSYFYYEMPNTQRLSPPYGKAYGYYRNHPSETVRWSDEDLVKLASVRFITESTRKPAHEALAIYQSRPRFIRTQKIVSNAKKHPHENSGAKEKHGNGHAKNKDKKDHGHHGKNEDHA